MSTDICSTGLELVWSLHRIMIHAMQDMSTDICIERKKQWRFRLAKRRECREHHPDFIQFARKWLQWRRPVKMKTKTGFRVKKRSFATSTEGDTRLVTCGIIREMSHWFRLRRQSRTRTLIVFKIENNHTKLYRKRQLDAVLWLKSPQEILEHRR